MKIIIKSIFIIVFIFCLNLNVSADINKQDISQKINKNNSSFENDLFSGIGSYKYNFEFPQGQRGLIQSLSLNYNTAKVDYLNDSGYGFNFGVESIFRSTKKGQDKLYNLDEYAINSSFSYNEIIKNGNGIFSGVNNNDLSKYSFQNDSWIVKDNSGNSYYFGDNSSFKQINPENNKTFRWVLSKKTDSFGNEIRYSYIKSDNNIYLSEINYVFKDSNPLYKIKINYLNKSFSSQSYIYGFKLENYKLLSSISLQTLVNGNYEDTKKYEIIYKDENTIFPKLIQIKESSGNQIKNTTSFEYYDSGIGINLIKNINNGKGLLTTLEYKSSGLYPNTTVPFLLKTLYKVTYKDTTTNLEYSNTYDYYGGNFYYDPANIYNRGYTGFNKVKVLEEDGSYKYLYFHQSDSDKNNSVDSQNGEFEDHISKKGKIYREEEYDTDGKIYTTKITKWIKQDKGNNIYFVMPERITNILWNKSGNHVDSSETFEYDTFGNITKNIKYGEVTAIPGNGDFTDTKSDKKTFEYTYASDGNQVFINNVCIEKVSGNSGNQISLNKYFYDNLGECLINKGLLTNKSIFYSEQNKYLSQNFTYENGNLKTESDFEGNLTNYTYDNYNLFQKTKTNPKNWTENYDYNYKIQKPTTFTDINGIIYKYYYDNFGNLTKKSIINPISNSENALEENTFKFDSIPNYIENRKYLDSSNYIVSRVYLDGFGREIETKVSSKYTDKFSTTKIKYDKRGNKSFISYPIFEPNLNYTPIGASEKGNTISYDALGKILSQTNKTGTTTFQYDLLRTEQKNQKGVRKFLYNDIFGNLIKVLEYNGSEIYETNYEYNQINKLTKIKDSAGNIRNFSYDSLGRQAKAEDLHAQNSTNFGSIEYTYTDNSLIATQKTMSGETINYTYDNIGRILNEVFGNEKNEFNYDIGDFAKGKLTKTSKKDYSEGYKYNYLGQKTEDKKVFLENNYTLKYEYNLDGSIKKVTYPDNKETQYLYENGYVNKISYNNNEILSNVDYEANNKPKKQVFANGITDEETFDYEYGYRLVSKKVSKSGFTHVKYEFKTTSNTKFLNISPLIYGQTGTPAFAMKAWVKNLSLVNSSIEGSGSTVNLIKNGNFSGSGYLNTNGRIGGSPKVGWYASFNGIKNMVYIRNNNLEMQANGGLLEVKTSSGGYYSVDSNTISVIPNTKYTIEYDYKTEYLGNVYLLLNSNVNYLSGNLDPGFSVAVFMASSNNVAAGDFRTQAFDKGQNVYQNLNYIFDNVGNITNITDTSNLGIQKNVTYTYDDLDRLLTSTIVSGSTTKNLSYTYNNIGNILSNSLVGNYNYTNGTNPQAVTQIGTGISLSYDKNGNVSFENINGINKSYIYNSKQELLTSSVNSKNTNYLYDNNSNRVQKINGNGSGSTLNRYLNNDFDIESVSTLNGSGNTVTQTKTSKYIYFGGQKIFTVENKDNSENIIYNLTDHLGGGNIDLSQTGAILQKADYYPYGGSRVLERNNNFKNKYLFTGKELDDETSLQYFEARYYNPDFGRFYGQDRVFWEIGNSKRGIGILNDPQQLNSYSYARNNPVIYVDPSGEIIGTILSGIDFLESAAKTLVAGIDWNIKKSVGNYLGIDSGQSSAGIKFKNSVEDLKSKGVELGYAAMVDTAFLAAQGLIEAKYTKDIIGNVTKVENGTDFFENFKYSDKVIKQMNNDIFHGFPSQIDDIIKESGKLEQIINGDGTKVYKLSIEGTINGNKGFFEYISNIKGKINHRFFNEYK